MTAVSDMHPLNSLLLLDLAMLVLCSAGVTWHEAAAYTDPGAEVFAPVSFSKGGR